MNITYAWGTYVLTAIIILAIGIMIAAIMKFYRVGKGHKNNNNLIIIIILAYMLVIIASFLLFFLL